MKGEVSERKKLFKKRVVFGQGNQGSILKLNPLFQILLQGQMCFEKT